MAAGERSSPSERNPSAVRLLTVRIQSEPDVVVARQRARQLAELLGFDRQDQVRLATATSEIARNAFQYAGGGRVEFFVCSQDRAALSIEVIDNGAGIADLPAILEGRFTSSTGMGVGLVGTQRLMDLFSIHSAPGAGTTVRFGKYLPPDSRILRRGAALSSHLQAITAELTQKTAQPVQEEARRQNQELLETLEQVQSRESELQQRQAELTRLNLELEETNRGVVALYAELDEKAEALRRANETKSRFLSHMSHEFRTPLNSILALTDLLLRHVDGGLTPDQQKQVGYIRDSAASLFEMVNDLLDLAKVEAGKIEVRKGPVELSQLLGGLRGMFRPLSSSGLVRLVIEDPPNELTLHTDEAKLSQILRNLISNALKFTEHGEVRLRVEVTPQQLLIRVSDTGIGIAPGDHARIFQDFTQVDHPIQRKVKGTGLGLPLSRQFAVLLGGSLTVESEPGRGSVFTFALPVEAFSSPDEPPAGEREDSLEPIAGTDDDDGPGTILIIDDEEVSRYLARQLFKGTAYRIIEAGSGSEGAERARFEHPKLVLLDLVMPDRSGFDVLEELQSDPLTRSIPVVIHTSRTLGPADRERLDGKCEAILPKENRDRDAAYARIRDILGEPNLFLELSEGRGPAA